MLALALGVRIEATSAPRALLAGNAVMVSPRLAPATLRWAAAHELGHWILREKGYASSERGADRVAEALLLPSYAFKPDGVGWHVAELQRLHRFCSLETIARRVLSLRPAVVTVWKRGKPIRRYYSGTEPSVLRRPTPFERSLANAAETLGGVLTAGDRMVGFVDDVNPERVVTLCGIEQLENRLAYTRDPPLKP